MAIIAKDIYRSAKPMIDRDGEYNGPQLFHDSCRRQFRHNGAVLDRIAGAFILRQMWAEKNRTVMRYGAAGVILALVWSGIDPRDRATWWMEVAPVLIAIPVLFVTYRRFTLTPLLYYLIGLHALVLIVGGAYTYAHVPFGYQLQDAFALSRNPYDKIGHFMQGFVPALIAREILLRIRCVSGRGMAGFLSVCVAVAVSAVYEMIEWGAALALGEGANEFLGMQGDPWDTQSDMFMALLGALVALASLGRLHNKQLAQIENSNARRVT